MNESFLNVFVVDGQVPVIIIGISLCEDLDNIIPNQIFNSRLITYYIEGYVLMQKIKHYQTYFYSANLSSTDSLGNGF